MKKGLLKKIARSISDLLHEVDPSWVQAGTSSAARRTGPWVQVIDIHVSRWADEFVPASDMTYLRAWDPIPYIGPTLLGSRLKTERHQGEDWITERRFFAAPNDLVERLRAQVQPRIDEPLQPAVAERLASEWVVHWYTHHVMCFIAAERLDRPAAEGHLRDLEVATAELPVKEWVEAAPAVVAMIDRPERLKAHLDAIEEAALAPVKGRPLG